MSLQTVRSYYVSSLQFPTGPVGASGTVNAAGESVATIGRVYLSGGTAGGSKTLSAAGGGSIIWATNAAVTFANAGTNLRVGLQDVNLTTGIEDTTFDVYADLVGGTDPITSTALQQTVMDTGTKTVAHNDLIAVVAEMTTRGGTDSVIFQRFSGSAGGSFAQNTFPYGTLDTGAGPGKNISPWPVLIVFDDGTVGWIAGAPLGYRLAFDTVTYGSTSTPDEYAAIFRVPYSCTIDMIGMFLAIAASSSTFELILYSDPLGTPTVIETVTPDTDVLFQGGSTNIALMPITPVTLTPNTDYAVALRPLTANTVVMGYFDLGSGRQVMKTCSMFGTNISLAARTNQTGAFSVTQVYHLPAVVLGVSALDNGISPVAFPFVG